MTVIDSASPRRPMRLWARMGLACLAGLVGVLGMAPFNLWPVLILALAAFYILLDSAAQTRRPIRTAAWTGWAFGFGYFAAGFYWVGEAFFVDPDTVWMMPFAVTLLPAGMAIYLGAAAALACAIPRRGAAGALVAAASFAGFEFVRGFLFTGFPWNLFGSAFIDSGAAQGAALVGIYGLTAIIMVAGFGLAAVWRDRSAFRFVPVVLGSALIACAFAYGAVRPAPDIAAPTIRVRLVQPDNPESEKGLPDYARRLWQRLISLTGQPGAKPVSVVVWPEGVTPFFLDEDPMALRVIGQTLEPGGILLAGSARRQIGDDGANRYYNSLFVVDGTGKITAVYDKAHLVPFGEYLPFPAFFKALNIASLTARVGGAFTSGEGRITLAPPGVPAFGPFICYEALFSGEIVAAGKRPRWLVNITDDSWFGTQFGPYQHLVAVRFRAIEEGLPIARSATTGISAMIDARGAVLDFAPIHTVRAIDADLPPAYNATLFSQIAQIPFWVLTASLLLFGLCVRTTKSSASYH